MYPHSSHNRMHFSYITIGTYLFEVNVIRVTITILFRGFSSIILHKTYIILKIMNIMKVITLNSDKEYPIKNKKKTLYGNP